MQVVPTVATPTNLTGLQALVDHGFATLGHQLTPTQRVNLTVLAAIETGQGGSMKNGNLGNISASAAYGGMAWRPPWFEPPFASPKMAALHDAMLKGTAPSAFRAYTSPLEGAVDFARQILHTFPEVLAGADQRDPDRFRLALGQKYSHDYLANRKVTDTIAALQKKLGLVATSVTNHAAGVAVAGLLYIAYRLLFKR